MIHSLYLKNFESHKNTKLIFSKGINIITGESDQGKSSIIRGIYWVKDNKPAGNSMVSFWNRDNKGNPKNVTMAEITNANTSVSRMKSSEMNGYYIGEMKLDAIGQKVPEEVPDALNLSDINIQYQFDRPFLLDESPLEVARFFNKIIKLDVIDRVLSKAEGLRKKTNAEIKSLEFNVETASAQIAKFSWIDSVAPLVKKLEALEYSIEDKNIKKQKLQKLIEDYEHNKAIIKENRKIANLSKIITQVDALTERIRDNKYKKSTIEELLATYRKQEALIKQCKEVKKLQKVVDRIEELTTIIKEKKIKKNILSVLIDDYRNNGTTIDEQKKEVKRLTALLPSVCPTCGKPL